MSIRRIRFALYLHLLTTLPLLSLARPEPSWATLCGPPRDAAVGSASIDHGLWIGPVGDLTTGWHPAPSRPVSLPRGLQLAFAVAVGPEEAVSWSGARDAHRDGGCSVAVASSDILGEMVVGALVRKSAEPSAAGVRQYKVVFDVVGVGADTLRVSPITVQPDPMQIPVHLSPEELNRVTVSYYFGGSVAEIRRRSDGSVVTSVDRVLEAGVVAEPAELAWLVEWRADGDPRWLGTESKLAFAEVGTHAVSAGPPDRAAAMAVETYSARIVSPPSQEFPPQDGAWMEYVVATDPPGFEDSVTWLASTKYGTGRPVQGRGRQFAARFDDTVAVSAVGGAMRWLGIKADNAVMGSDSPPNQFLPLMEQLEVDLARSVADLDLSIAVGVDNPSEVASARDQLSSAQNDLQGVIDAFLALPPEDQQAYEDLAEPYFPELIAALASFEAGLDAVEGELAGLQSEAAPLFFGRLETFLGNLGRVLKTVVGPVVRVIGLAVGDPGLAQVGDLITLAGAALDAAFPRDACCVPPPKWNICEELYADDCLEEGGVLFPPGTKCSPGLCMF